MGKGEKRNDKIIERKKLARSKILERGGETTTTIAELMWRVRNNKSYEYKKKWKRAQGGIDLVNNRNG